MNLSISWDVKKKKLELPETVSMASSQGGSGMFNFVTIHCLTHMKCVPFCTYATFHNFKMIIFSLPSGTFTKVKHPSSFFCFLSNYRIVKLWKPISCLTGSVYLSKRSRKQTRGILIDCFPCTTNLNCPIEGLNFID